MKHPITHTRDNTSVYVDLINSPSATTISEQPHILVYVREVLRKTSVTSKHLRLETDMGRTVGYDFIMDIGEDDPTFYGKLSKDGVHTKFIKKGEPKSTPFISIILRQDESGDYELHDTWIGRLYPSLPDSPDEMPESKAFWKTHARIFNHQTIRPRTITSVCPYST